MRYRTLPHLNPDHHNKSSRFSTGFVSPSGGNPFFSEIILYFERAEVEKGYEALISFADTKTHSNHVAICAQRLQERQVDGIAALTFGMEEQLGGISVGVPVVYAVADRDLPGVRNVRINYLPGFREEIRHLAEFGHELSTVQFSPRDLAGLAFRALIEEIQQAEERTSFDYKTRFILRESTCAPRSSSAESQRVAARVG